MKTVSFVQPMEALQADKVPVGANWTYEIKLDGFRAEAIKRSGRVTLYSRRRNEFRFADIVSALEDLPDETVIDGEVAALDAEGRPSFSLLQNRKSEGTRLMYFVFDVLIHKGQEMMHLPLSERRLLLRSILVPNEHISISEWSDSADGILKFVHQHHLEGIVAKRADSRYEPGKRSGAWTKIHRLIRQEFVIGGFTPSHLGIDALIVGFYRGKDLLFAGRVRAGFTGATRRTVFERVKHLETSKCPFRNLPDKTAGTFGQGLTEEAMKKCTWLLPSAVAEIEFTEWTPGDRLRRASFLSLRGDKPARRVVKET